MFYSKGAKEEKSKGDIRQNILYSVQGGCGVSFSGDI